MFETVISLVVLQSVFIEAYMGYLASRSFCFQDVRKGQRLTGNDVLQISKVYSYTFCGLKCGRTAECRSFNFCHPKRCELNAEDIFSLGNKTEVLQADPYCDYHGMVQNFTPQCKEKDDTSLKDIQDDSNPGNCEINQKRVDDRFAAPEVKEVLRKNEYQKYDFRDHVTVNAHGGIILDVESVEFIFWIIKSPKGSPWPEAKSFCESIGGKLFSNLDGTKAQLDLVYKMEERSYWLGVYTEKLIQKNKWKNIDGNAINSEKIYWDSNSGYPKDNDALTHLFIQFTNSASRRDYIRNTKPTVNRYALCDML